MIVKNIGHSCSYDVNKICTIFFPDEKIREAGDDSICVVAKEENGILSVEASAYGKTEFASHRPKQNEDTAYALSVLLFNVLKKLTGFVPPWGLLFGVRPAKLMHRHTDETGVQEAKRIFRDRYFVSEKKTELAAEVMINENMIIDLSRDNSFSLYISIPFCTTRCSYCSFVSHSIERTKHLIQPYTELLCRELESVAAIADRLELRLETIYWGGGTPTTLSAAQLDTVLKTINKSFDLTHLREYTVEAGRPDTITSDKLSVLKEAGVGRISINPQTFNDDILTLIGRRHTVRMTIDAFNLARKFGFDNINMDLIAGLPTDTLDSFINSVDSAVDLGADSITVHTLAMKSASDMVADGKTCDYSAKLLTGEMVDYSFNKLKASGYQPYYMYRQSKSLGNLENVGWAKQGKECLYNVYMMDETHSVIAVGAGGVTRLIDPKTRHIERIYNYKYPYEYVDNFDEIINRKDGILSFYGEY